MTSLRVDEVRGLAPFSALAPAWADLCRRDPSATPFQRPEWLLPYCLAFGILEPWGVAAWCGDRLAALLPLVVYREGGRRIATLLGGGRSDWQDAIVDPDLAPAAAERLLERVAERGAAYDRLLLERLPAGGWLGRAPAPGGLATLEEGQDEPCPAVDLPPAVEDLRRRLAPRLLESLRYGRRRLARMGTVAVARAGPADLERHLAALFGLHRARWSVRGDRGVLHEDAVRRFHAGAARALSAAGLLRGYRLTVGGRDAAVFHGFEMGGRLFYYVGGFDPAFRGASPGAVLLAHVAEEAVRSGVRRLEFLRGREPYKYAWGALDERALRRVLAPRSTTLGRAVGGAPAALEDAGAAR